MALVPSTTRSSTWQRRCPATVATLDAIHLATALELASGGVLEAVMTYGARLAEGAEQHGLRVLAPD